MDGWTQGRRARLVSPRRRRTAVVVAVLGALVTALLGWRFSGHEHAGGVDRWLAGLVQMRTGTVKAVGQGFADLGGPVPIGTALVLLAVLAAAFRGRRGLALVLIGPPLAMVATSIVLKPLIDRTRDETLAFPSGHTTSVASTALAAGILLVGAQVVPPLLRRLGAAALVVLVVAVAVSLVGRGYHYPTDTVGAVGVVLAIMLTVAVVIDLVADAWADMRWTDDPWDGPTETLPVVSRHLEPSSLPGH